jgi:preprotein translocase subunit SecE
MNDRIKFALGAILVMAGLGAYYYLSERALIIRVLVLLAGLAAGAALSWATAPGQDFRGFALESWAEAKRVVWPSRKETWQTTGVVFALVVVMGMFLFLVDLGIVKVVSILMGRSE